PKGKTQACRIVDATLVERFEDACRRLRLVGRGRGDHLLRGWVGRRRGVESRAADAKTRIRFLPRAPPAAAALPHTGQVRLAGGRGRGRAPGAGARRGFLCAGGG